MCDYNQTMRAYVNRTELALNDALSAEVLSLLNAPPQYADALRYSVFSGGKHLRAALVYAGAELSGVALTLADPFAAAIELIHTYSLIHDDLPAMDNDDYRRGKPSNHKVFGEGMAILAGDGLLTHAAVLMAEACVSRPESVRSMRAILGGAGIGGMCGGQALDLLSERTSADGGTLLRIIEGKTAALIRASLVAGVMLGEPSEDALDAALKYGTSLGFAFQIVDDILDVTGDLVKTGKSTGIDERNGKLTYIAAFGLDRAVSDAKMYASEASEAISRLPGSSFLAELALQNAARCT